MSLAAGELTHRIKLVEIKTTQDPTTGEMIKTECERGKIWARVTHLSGKELIAGQASASKVTARIKIRQREINHEWIIEHRNLRYNIEAVTFDNESGYEWLTLHCSEGVQRGAR